MEIGEKKYRLTLISKESRYGKSNSRGWKQLRHYGVFQCECGKRIEAEIYSVDGKKANTQSCGCLRLEKLREKLITHGRGSRRFSEHYQTYSSWQHMKDRCLNPKNKYYKNYGERGITVCDRWMTFENFLDDMGDRTKELSLDRIDNNKGYSKENCKWSTRKEQMNNTRRNRH